MASRTVVNPGGTFLGKKNQKDELTIHERIIKEFDFSKREYEHRCFEGTTIHNLVEVVEEIFKETQTIKVLEEVLTDIQKRIDTLCKCKTFTNEYHGGECDIYHTVEQKLAETADSSAGTPPALQGNKLVRQPCKKERRRVTKRWTW